MKKFLEVIGGIFGIIVILGIVFFTVDYMKELVRNKYRK